MTTTRTYASTDTGAPVLTGEVGALTNVLQKCLVDGYGSKVAAGWSLAFSGANKIALRNSLAAGGTGHYFRIQDDGADALGARAAWLRGYVDMTDVDTPVGADVIPRSDWYPNGGRTLKSTTANATARAWHVWADEITAWVWIDAEDEYQVLLVGFGDFESYVAADNYRSFVCIQTDNVDTDSINSSIVCGWRSGFASCFSANQDRGIHVMRGYSGGAAGAVSCGVAMMCDSESNAGSESSGGGSSPIQNAVSPGVEGRFFMPLYMAAENSLRGRLRGVYGCLNNCQSLPKVGYEIAAVGLPSGSVLQRVQVSPGAPYNNTSVGCVALETGLEW